ncbi:MAG TPA: peptidase M23 [Gammaproteobacteria bacterium]|nr:peptidase M23 [Gammaproteobacteria bacterium]
MAMLGYASVLTIISLVFLPDDSEAKKTVAVDAMVESELTLSFADNSRQQPVQDVLPAANTRSPLPEASDITIQPATTATVEANIQPAVIPDVIKVAALPVSHSDKDPVAIEEITAAVEAIDPSALSWQTIKVKSGDSMARIFKRAELSASELHAILKSGSKAKKLRNIHPGQKLRFATGPNGQLEQLQYKINEITTLEIKRAQSSYQSRLITRNYETRITHAAGTIHHSLFLAGMEAGLTDSMTMDLAGIFGWDIDFALDIRSGDRFVVVYEEKYLDGRKVRNGNILAAEFFNNNKTYRSIRYTDANGNTGFYDADGRSMRKAFLRTPVDFSRISSRFSSGRKHPVLNRIRAHKGVDYAASRGTPIRATGDGKIIYRGRKGGYGKAVIIRHGSRYTTLYAHMNNYNRKARLGSRVKQGQVIGYVGSSGLATGPHLHYEFRLNGVHRNPLTVRLPKSASLAKKYLPDFKQTADPLLSRLDTLNRTLLAMSGQENK